MPTHPRLSIPRSSNQQEWQSMRHAYLLFLNNSGLRESDMHESQRFMMRRTFFAGTTSMLGVMLEVFSYGDEEQADALSRLIEEDGRYWQQ
jgi:hypothetical protein